MGQSAQEVITPQVDSEENPLSTPHFDDVSIQMARPVVPLSDNALSTNPVDRPLLGSKLTALLQKKGSWLLATVIGLVLAVGAMAIGVTAYRRNQVVSTQSFVPAVAATRMEINQDYRPDQSSSSVAPAAPKTKKSRPVARQTNPGSPKARLVDRYVLR